MWLQKDSLWADNYCVLTSCLRAVEMVFNEVLPILNIFHLPLDPTIYFLLYVGHLDTKYFITGILLIICYADKEFLLA